MSSDSTDKDATGVAVRRFDDCDVCGGMVMSDCGGYVSIEDFRAEHADYLALQAQYDALKAAADGLSTHIEWCIRDLSYKAREQISGRALEHMASIVGLVVAYRAATASQAMPASGKGQL
jgi:hypothetical protein